MTLGGGSSQVLRFSPVRITPSVHRSRSFVYRRRCVIWPK